MKVLKILFLTAIALMAFLNTPGQVPGEYPFEKYGGNAKNEIFKAPGADSSGLINSTSYVFSGFSGVALDDMSSGTTGLLQTVTGPGSSSQIVPIGFLFRFDGATFDTFSANSNGFIMLGARPAPSSPTGVNLISSDTYSPKIAPYWNNLCFAFPGSATVRYKITGTAGSKKLIVEWARLKVNSQGCGTQPDATFQLWLFEGTGVIQFVYGPGMAASDPAGGGYSVGIQSGLPGNFASVTTSTGGVSYTVPDDTQLSSIPVGISYVFTPEQPAAPTAGSVSDLAQTSLKLNWTDNAVNESGYQVRRSTDNINFSIIGEVPAGATAFTDSGLVPNTQYFYRVYAFTAGGFSQSLGFSALTQPMRSISSTAGGSGLWSDPATWAQGIVPAEGDNVAIASGSNITLDVPASVWSLEIGTAGSVRGAGWESGAGGGASLVFDPAAAQTLTVRTNVLVDPDGFLGSAPTGTVTNHLLTLGGDLTNNGTLDFSTNNNTAGGDITFTGATNNVFGGAGPVTDVRKVKIAKGNSAVNTLEFAMSNFTVHGSTTETPASAFLILSNGTVKISGTFTGNHRTFEPGYGLSAKTGLWLNNPNYTIEGQPGSVDLRGALRVTAGNYNIGTAVDDSLIINSNSTITIEGGSIGVAGRLSVAATNTSQVYKQTGGTVTTCKVGQTSTSFACFDMGTLTIDGNFVYLTGGDIVIQNAASATTGPRDYRNRTAAGMDIITGTNVVFGNEFTSGPSNFGAVGNLPNVIVNTVAGGHTVELLQPVVFSNSSRDVEIQPGGTFDIGNYPYNMQGNSFINNGTLKADRPGAVLTWYNESPTYSGSGVTAGLVTSFEVFCPQLTLDPAVNNIRARRIKLAEGNIINANKLTLGNNDSIPSEIVMGNESPLETGSFDTAPVFELGTGGQKVTYLRRVTNSFTTGPEINPQRVLAELTYDGTRFGFDTLNISGGDVTVTGDLVLSFGEIATGSNKIIHTGNALRQSGVINGTLERVFSAPGSYAYHLGSNSSGAYTPVTATVSAVNGSPSKLSVSTTDATLPGLPPPLSASRYWSLLETGDITATLEFSYHMYDIMGDESDYRTWRSSGGPPVYVPGSTVNTASNIVTSAPGITELTGDWGLGIAPVSFSGRVLTAGGTPIRNAVMTLTGGNLTVPRVVQTGNFGTYIFDELLAGQTYTLRIGAKRYRFSQLSWEITPQWNIINLDFIANPQ